MKYLQYEKLKLQPYFQDKSISIEAKQTKFRWRTHMENFKHNCKCMYDAGSLECDFCSMHQDSQEKSITCKAVNNDDEPKSDYSELFKTDEIPHNIVKTIMRITKTRTKMKETI